MRYKKTIKHVFSIFYEEKEMQVIDGVAYNKKYGVICKKKKNLGEK